LVCRYGGGRQSRLWARGNTACISKKKKTPNAGESSGHPVLAEKKSWRNGMASRTAHKRKDKGGEGPNLTAQDVRRYFTYQRRKGRGERVAKLRSLQHRLNLGGCFTEGRKVRCAPYTEQKKKPQRKPQKPPHTKPKNQQQDYSDRAPPDLVKMQRRQCANKKTGRPF